MQLNTNSVIWPVHCTDIHSPTIKLQLMQLNINSVIWPVYCTDIHSSTLQDKKIHKNSTSSTDQYTVLTSFTHLRAQTNTLEH